MPRLRAVPTSDRRRVARSALAAAALGVVTLAGHTAAGGGVDLLGLAVLAAVSIALGSALVRRTPSVATLFVGLVGAEAVLHLVLTVAGGHGHPGAHPSTTAMIGGHVLAAFVVALVVVHADRILASWSRLLAAVLGHRVDLPRAPEVAPLAAHGDTVCSPTLQRLRHRVPRRGPPALIAHALA